MKNKLGLCDGNFYLWRAMSVVAGKRNPQFLAKNTLSMFVSMIASDLTAHKTTHALVCFDAARTFRHDLYKGYKANRGKEKGTTIHLADGSEFHTDITPGSLVKDAIKIMALAGLATAHKPLHESDDLMASASKSVDCPVVIMVRDKDLAAMVDDRVSLYWPTEKILLKPKDVRKKWGVNPDQIRDYLCLLGDKIDCIPGIPGVGAQTACKWLNEHGSIGACLKDPKIGPKLKEHGKILLMAKKLVTLRTDVKFRLEDMAINPVDPKLGQHIWKIPDKLKDLGDVRKLQTLKGLFK